MAHPPPEPHDPTMHNLSSPSPGPVSQTLRQRINRRTHELAELARRIPPRVTQSDYEQAKRELTGESDAERQSAAINAQPAYVTGAPVN